MARERSPERDKAKQMWLESGGTMELKDIAAALSIGETQVRKWKSQDKWAADLKGNVTIRESIWCVEDSLSPSPLKGRPHFPCEILEHTHSSKATFASIRSRRSDRRSPSSA